MSWPFCLSFLLIFSPNSPFLCLSIIAFSLPCLDPVSLCVPRLPAACPVSHPVSAMRSSPFALSCLLSQLAIPHHLLLPEPWRSDLLLAPGGPVQSLPGRQSRQSPLCQGRITSQMREGVQLEGPGTGAKSSYSQRTKFFCPVKSPPGSRQGTK